MKRHIHHVKPVLIILLVLCTLLSSCVTDAPIDNGTTGTHEHITTQKPDEGDNNTPPEGGGTVACTHATTTLVGATAATCSKEGYTGDTVCSACTEIVVKGTSIAKLEHTWNGGDTTKIPTCISTGVKTFTCTGCGETKTETLGTVKHNDLYHDRLDGTHSHTCSTCTLSENKEHNPIDGSAQLHAATCLEGAYTEYTCADCHGVYKVYSDKEEDKATGHTFGAWEILSDSTCCETGLKTRHCTNPDCSEHEELEIAVDEKKHRWEEESRTLATCSANGSVNYVCSVCDEPKSEPLLKNNVHTYQTLESKGDGWTVQECLHCHNQISSFNAADVVVAEVKADKIPDGQNFGVTTEKATIEFPENVVSQIKGNGTATDIAIGAEVVQDKENLLANASNLSAAQKERLNDVEIFDFSVKVDNQKLEQNFAEPVTVTMPYELKEGENPDGIIIWYVADNGDIDEIEAVYDPVTKTVTFAAEHFSFYAVAYKETQEMQCRRGHHNYQPTGEVVQATCETFGYTVHKCVCGAKMLDDIVDKKGHEYGDLIKAQVDCEQDGWDHQICSKCGDVLNIKYVAANGHKPDKVASCTEASTCTVCNKVVKPALGHAWNEWVTVLEPTEVNSGLRRRYCPVCGEKEEVRLAATGNIQAITFETYEEMLGALLSETLNFGNGAINVSYIMNGVTYAFDMKVNETDGAYTVLVDLTMSAVIDGQSVSQTLSGLYRNGVLAYVRETGEGTVVESFELEALIGAPFEIFWDYAEQTFTLIDPSVAMALTEIKVMLDEYGALYAEDINKALAAAGSTFTYASLTEILDSFETVYAYAALKLGFESSLGMHEGVEIPTKNDFVNVISAFMTKTESEGRVDYEWNVEPLLNSLNQMIAVLTDACEMPLSELFYAIFGEDIVAANPALTDWSKCVEYISTNIPGTTTIKTAVDWLITVLEESEICTVDEVYALVDAYVYEMTGEEFDTAAFIAANGSRTLDEMVQAIVGEEDATLEMLYQGIDQMLTQTLFGELTLMIQGEEIAINDLVEMAAGYLAMFDVTLDFSFAVDEKGNLLEIDLDHKLAVVGKGENGETVTQEIEQLNMAFRIDDSVKVDVPAIMQPVVSSRVTASYDQQGNLIISGLDGSFTYKFSIKGYDDFKIAELLQRDDAMSAQLGCDVYKTDKAFWNRSTSASDVSIVQINGKYYEMNREWINSYTEVVSTFTWTELLADPTVIMPTADATVIGFYNDMPVYSTLLGYVYQGAEGWMLMTEYDYHFSWREDGTGKEREYRIFSVWQETAVANALTNAYIGEISHTNQKVTVNGEEIWLSALTLKFNESSSVRINCYLEDDTVVLVELRNVEGRYVYTLGNELTALPEHDSMGYGDSYITYENASGEEVTEDVRFIYLSKKLPTYYVKLANGTVIMIDNLCDDVNVDGLTQLTLPDGNVMYVLGSVAEKNNNSGNMGGSIIVRPDGSFDSVDKVVVSNNSVMGSVSMNGTASDTVISGGTISGGMVSGSTSVQNGRTLTYGYVKVAEGLYVQVRCYVTGETVENVVYRDVEGDRWAALDMVYDLSKFMTKNSDGTYTVSAELLSKLKAQCTDEGDAYAFDIVGTKSDNNGTTYSTYATVGTYMVPETLQLGGMTGSDSEAEKWIDWDYLFSGKYGDNNDGPLYQAHLNPDGSLSLVFRDGAKLDVEIDAGKNLIADDYLIRDEVKSQETGLNIYKSQKTNYDVEELVYIDGQYYPWTYAYCYAMTVAEDLDALISNGWFIRNFTYRYDLEQEDGTYIPVYDARISFQRDTGWNFGSNFITVFFALKDGELYALKQATELGDGILRFEEMVKASEYFASLKAEVNANSTPGQTASFYVNGELINLYYESVMIYETDANGERLTDGKTYYITVYYMLVNGEKQYVSLMNYLNEYYLIVQKDSTFDLTGYTKTDERDSKYANGTFRFVVFEKPVVETEYFVKLAGKCYRLENYYYSYYNQRIPEKQFNEMFSTKLLCYRVWDEAANAYKYYRKCDFVTNERGEDVPVLSEEFTMDIIGELVEDKIGYTAEGLVVQAVTVRYLDPKSVVITEQTDGTVLYTYDGGKSYLKAQDGYYVRVREVTVNENGETELICDLDRAYVDSGALNDMGAFNKYFTVEGNNLTISADIFELINDDNRWDFRIEIYVGNDWVTLDYNRLIEMFNIQEDDGNDVPTKPDDGEEDKWGDDVLNEEDTWVDVNCNGKFDEEDEWKDLNGNGKFDGNVPGADSGVTDEEVIVKPEDGTATDKENGTTDGEVIVKPDDGTATDKENGTTDGEVIVKPEDGTTTDKENGTTDGEVIVKPDDGTATDKENGTTDGEVIVKPEDGTTTDKEVGNEEVTEPEADQEEGKEDVAAPEIEKEDVREEITESDEKAA